ncbi:Ubiquitin carboxyl-terminal hydrolase 2 [Candida viswanathii]|uniref:Ubiquitin carboxyl-terminal hydrolase 2 n=1 Tax=Candida viswanathii TaxID=5486 RepID=A0A367XZM2_9ASCO|nr:Ubiquitin carboxyl-terminal hydrolase 2 [Candida viswanathii]
MSSDTYKNTSHSSHSLDSITNPIDDDSDDESPVSVPTNNSPENPPNQFHPNNPFRSSTTAASETPQESTPVSQQPPDQLQQLLHLRTKIPNQELVKYPFKTLNRILDDLKWTVPVQEMYNFSLLNSKPIDYSEELSRVVDSSVLPYNTLILNNDLDYCRSVEKLEYPETQQVLYVVRGLLLDSKNRIYHFRILALETNSNPFVTKIIDKHQYHVIPKTRVSAHDLQLLYDNNNDAERIVDDSFYRSLNSPNGQILRVTLFKPEFSKEDLVPLTDEEIIKERYLAGTERHPNLSPETIPNSIHCIKTLIKVLKGPVTLKSLDTIKTISLKNTVMDAQIDVNLLFDKLSFTLNGDEVVPPNLNNWPGLRESYIRKILELIYFAKNLDIPANEFQSLYSFSETMSQVFNTIVEFDKHMSITNFNSNYSNRFPFFISLSAAAYFPDELIIKCFELSVQSDPTNSLYYVDSLKQVRNFRSSGHSFSNGKLDFYFRQHQLVGFSDYLESMKIIGLAVENNDVDTIDDEVIIAMYRTQIKSDPRNYQYFNDHLRKIATIKKSDKLSDFIHRELLPTGLALDELSIEEITEDDVVITAYEFKLDDLLQRNGFNAEANEISLLNKALLSVAVHRKSCILLNYLETKMPDLVKIPAMDDLTISKAYDLLGLNNKANESEIIAAFQNKSIEESDVRLLRCAFIMIAEVKKSEILFSFAKTGKIDTSLLPAENWPAGLDNIGNTCYLNSLLQYYFCIKPLRDLILTFNEKDYKVADYSEDRKVGGRKVEESEVQRSSQFIYQLRRLFEEMIFSNQRCVQPNKELAYLSFLPLSQPVNFRRPEKAPKTKDVQGAEEEKGEVIEVKVDEDEANNLVIEHREESVGSPLGTDVAADAHDVTMIDEDSVPTTDNGNADDDVILVDIEDGTPKQQQENDEEDEELETPDTSSDDDHHNAALPKILPILTDQIESTIEVGRQQDVTECIENVIFQIETALPPQSLDKDGEQYDLIKKLFYGKTKQTITPLDKSFKSRVSLERFFSLIINVSDHPKSIYDALDYYFNEDIVKLEEGLVKKSITILELPQILQFHVQRVMFDRERLMAYKSIEPIPFSDKIYLDRYLDTEDEEILTKRNQVFEWKREIKSLQDQKAELLKTDEDTSLNIIDNLKITKKYLENRIILDDSLSIELTTIQIIQLEIDKLSAQLLKIDSQIEKISHLINNQFIDYKEVCYDIFAIFIHRGEASYGHYWIYIKDPQNKNIFRKYNDEIVTEVPSSEVFNFLETNTATPYYIVYVKDELEQNYIEPLKREIK